MSIVQDSAASLKAVWDWMRREGAPDPTKNMSADTIILMDIAVNIRKLVQLSEESMAINQAVLAQLDMDDVTPN